MTDPGDDRPPPASGAKTFNQWLGGGVPTAVAGIVIAKLSEYLNLWFVLPALGAAALYGVWKAPTVAHGPLTQPAHPDPGTGLRRVPRRRRGCGLRPMDRGPPGAPRLASPNGSGDVVRSRELSLLIQALHRPRVLSDHLATQTV